MKKLSEIGSVRDIESLVSMGSNFWEGLNPKSVAIIMTPEERREFARAIFKAGSKSGNSAVPGLTGFLIEDFNEFLDSEGL